MVQDPKKWSQLLCMVYIPTLVTWPQVTLKKVVPSTSNRSWTLGRQQLDTHTHTNIWEKYRKVASRGCSLQPTCWYFNLFFPTSPCGVLFFGAASPASPSPPPSPPSVVRPSAHHIASIIQITIAQTSRYPPYHASSPQHCPQDIITHHITPYHTMT